jgi:heme a synthase
MATTVRPGIEASAEASAIPAVNDRAVANWLLASAIVVVLTLVVGGVTRLTESGLSITEWNPVSGMLPPFTADAWQAAYQSYLQIPEAQTVHKGISLDEFKNLFWWEWLHRNMGRAAGLVIALPWVLLTLRGRIRPELRFPLALMPILTAAQGVLGWYMVSSGLSGRTDVSPYRLVAHLMLALTIFVIAVWALLRLVLPGHPSAIAHTARSATDLPTRGSRSVRILAVLSFVTIASGGFVAGLDAGHVYNSFPLMGEGLVPREYGALEPAWRNWFENAPAAQFNHRLLAMATVVGAVLLWLTVARRASAAAVRRAGAWVGIAAIVQVALGISTLLLRVPIPLAALHQLGAVALLACLLWLSRETAIAEPVAAAMRDA